MTSSSRPREPRAATPLRALPGGRAQAAAVARYGDDATLVAAAIAKEPDAARAMWDRFSSLVRGLLFQILGPSTDPEDLVQDVFLHLFRRLRDLRDPSALSSFVVGMTIRTARSELRRRRLRRWLSLSEDGHVPDVPERAVDLAAREALSRLYAVLDQVSADVRVVFVLRFVRGLELTEVAAMTNCSLATVKRRLSRAETLVRSLARREPALVPYLDVGQVDVGRVDVGRVDVDQVDVGQAPVVQESGRVSSAGGSGSELSRSGLSGGGGDG